MRLGTPLAEDDSTVVLRASVAGPAVDYAPGMEEDNGGPEPVPPEFGTEPGVRTLQSAVGLVWRAVVLWMLLLAMLSLALWVG
ncbi:hypothetical protein D9M72_438670 [compost metagenome]